MNELELFLRFSFLGLSSLISIISLLSLDKNKGNESRIRLRRFPPFHS